MTNVGEVNISKADGNQGGEYRSIRLFSQRSRVDCIDNRRIIGAGNGDGDGSTATEGRGSVIGGGDGVGEDEGFTFA